MKLNNKKPKPSTWRYGKPPTIKSDNDFVGPWCKPMIEGPEQIEEDLRGFRKEQKMLRRFLQEK